MMNEKGIIIASSEIERIKRSPADIKEIIANNFQAVVVKSDSKYRGARSGINLAINCLKRSVVHEQILANSRFI